MKVILATPNFHQPRGNTVTVKRIAEGLEKLGIETEVISMTEDNPVTALPSADIVHGFHAYRFYKFKEQLDEKITNFVITLTGTDLNHDLFNENKRTDVLSCLTEAKIIHVFDKDAKSTLINELPNLESKIAVVHQGTSEFPVEKPGINKEKDTFLFVLPAGIRKVKNIPAAIKMLNKLHTKFPMIRLWLVGPIIEEEEGKIVKDLVTENKDWIKYIGQVDHSQMGTIYNQADTILNTSHSEGQSSAILEGMGHGIPVLVAGNQGNRSIVSDGQTGLVYNTSNQFLDYAEQIMNNIELRKELVIAAKNYISKTHSSTYEAEHLLSLYKSSVQ
ncbi:glycosyltransferase family 4 protein [Virgibacillus necropolis]|uniref:glycosyltransferase family 4 protein n=1 Tax=Virgibacillus necropolis TaxID=163877 RepID=UPI00126A6A5A|nr:glycosyltransferase family 4 protein [Virgibacillus necropolis]